MTERQKPSATGKFNPNELDKLSPVQIVKKYGLGGTDIKNEYWLKRAARQFGLGQGQETDKILDAYAHIFIGDEDDEDDTRGSFYDAFHGLAGKLGYPTTGELEGGAEPRDLLLPTLQRGDMKGFEQILSDLNVEPPLGQQADEYPDPYKVEQMLEILAKRKAWEEMIVLMLVTEDLMDEAITFEFLPEVLAYAPQNEKDKILTLINDAAEEVGVLEEWKDVTLPMMEAKASILLGKPEKLNSLREDEILQTAVATGNPKIVRTVLGMINTDEIREPTADIIIGGILAGKLTQADLNQLDLEELQLIDPERDGVARLAILGRIFNAFIQNPNKKIFDLLIANKLIPGDIIIDSLMDNIPSWDPIWISLVNQRKNMPPYFDVDRHHQFDKQAHLYLAKRFPDYITREQMDKIFFNSEEANAAEIILALSEKMPGINDIKEASA